MDLFESLKTSRETMGDLKQFMEANHFVFNYSKSLLDQDYPSESFKKSFLTKLNQHLFSYRFDLVQFLKENKYVDKRSIHIQLSHGFDRNYDRSISSYIMFKLKDLPEEVQIRISDHKIILPKNSNLTYFTSVMTYLSLLAKARINDFIDTCYKKLTEKYHRNTQVIKGNNSKVNTVVVRQKITPRKSLREGEYDNLTGTMRVAGFYDVTDNKFILLKRKEIVDYDNGDNSFDYNHNASFDYLEEMNYVRFGIEDLGKITCYIEATSKVNARRAKASIERKFKEIPIEKFELEYEDNNEYQYEEFII